MSDLGVVEGGPGRGMSEARTPTLADAVVADLKRDVVALTKDLESARVRVGVLEGALRDEIKRVCECGGEDSGEGPGVGVIDSERSSFDYGADAYDGAGNVITEYYDCPCASLRAVLASGEAAGQG